MDVLIKNQLESIYDSIKDIAIKFDKVNCGRECLECPLHKILTSSTNQRLNTINFYLLCDALRDINRM